MNEFLSRHKKIAFQFSGGRDSLAALYLLRPYWSKFVVYHVDGGDQFPETKEVVRRVSKDVPIVVIRGDVTESYKVYGLPSDIVPTDNTHLGMIVNGPKVLMQDRYACCLRTIMMPLFDRMVTDGITGIIRGVRSNDLYDAPAKHGDRINEFEFNYPIWNWTSDRVMAYLESEGIEPAQFYKHGLKTTPECMSCSAWWDDKRGAYLRKFHPVAFVKYRADIGVVMDQIEAQISHLRSEMNEATNA